MSDGMGRELAYLSSHATNRYFIPNWGIIYIFLLTHNNIKHHHQHETYGEADGAEIAVLAA